MEWSDDERVRLRQVKQNTMTHWLRVVKPCEMNNQIKVRLEVQMQQNYWNDNIYVISSLETVIYEYKDHRIFSVQNMFCWVMQRDILGMAASIM